MTIALTETPLLIFLFGKPSTAVKGLDCVPGSTTVELGDLWLGQEPDAVEMGLGLLCRAPPSSERAPRCGMALPYSRAVPPSYASPISALRKPYITSPQNEVKTLSLPEKRFPAQVRQLRAPTPKHPRNVPIRAVTAAVPWLFPRKPSCQRSASLQPSVLNA